MVIDDLLEEIIVRNPERGSAVELVLMATVGASVAGFVCAVFESSVVAGFVFGASYGMIAYLLWWTLVTCAGSLMYDEEDEPQKLTWATGAGSFMLPVVSIVAVVLAVVVAFVGIIFMIKDRLQSMERPTES